MSGPLRQRHAISVAPQPVQACGLREKLAAADADHDVWISVPVADADGTVTHELRPLIDVDDQAAVILLTDAPVTEVEPHSPRPSGYERVVILRAG